jgi:hypothetical protein
VGALRAVLDEARGLVREKDAQLDKAASTITSLEAELARARHAAGREAERALRAERRAAALERAMGIVHGDIAPGAGAAGAPPPRIPSSDGGGGGDGDGDSGGGGGGSPSPSFSFPAMGEDDDDGDDVASSARREPHHRRRGMTSTTAAATASFSGFAAMDEETARSAAAAAAAAAVLAHPVMEVETALAESLRAARRREREMLRHLEGAAADLAAAEGEVATLRAAAEAESAGRNEAEREAAKAMARVGVLEARLAAESQSHPPPDVISSSTFSHGGGFDGGFNAGFSGGGGLSYPVVYPVVYPVTSEGPRAADEEAMMAGAGAGAGAAWTGGGAAAAQRPFTSTATSTATYTQSTPVHHTYAALLAMADDTPINSSRPRVVAPPPTPASAREFLMQRLAPQLQPPPQQPQQQPQQQWGDASWVHSQLEPQPRRQQQQQQQQSPGGGGQPSPSPSPGLVSLLNKAAKSRRRADVDDDDGNY